VKLKAFKKLTGRFATRFAGIEKALRKNCLREKRRFQKNNSIAVANRILRKTERRVRDLKIKSVGWAVIEPGLMQSYCHGREIYKLVRAKPSPENFHEWRKHVKDLWYYFRMLRPAWTRELRAMTDDLESLGEQLGDGHDLVLLKQFVAKRCAGQAGEVKALSKLIESRQKKLRAAALSLGSRLYSEGPPVICKRLESCWSVWRGEKRDSRI
jgi:CHAD domain-containing protein